MAPHPSVDQAVSTPSPTLSSNIPQESQTGLPGMKRGIAIGVACSVAVVLIALVTYFAFKRRSRITLEQQEQRNSKANYFNGTEPETWPQEKIVDLEMPPSLPTLPPVEADARTIYEMDATQVPELPSHTHAQEMETSPKINRNSWFSDDDVVYMQKLQQWETWNGTLHTPEQSNVRNKSDRQLPLLTISPPDGCKGNISPLLISPWDGSSRSASPVDLSPLPDAHLPSHRRDIWNR